MRNNARKSRSAVKVERQNCYGRRKNNTVITVQLIPSASDSSTYTAGVRRLQHAQRRQHAGTHERFSTQAQDSTKFMATLQATRMVPRREAICASSCSGNLGVAWTSKMYVYCCFKTIHCSHAEVRGRWRAAVQGLCLLRRTGHGLAHLLAVGLCGVVWFAGSAH